MSSKLTNTIILHNEYVEIIVESKDSYKHIVFIDTEDLTKIGKVRITTRGYAYTCMGKNVAHLVMNHTSNYKTVVDHKNGNTLDNRKVNLRVVDQLTNNHNKHTFVKNNTGIIGISYKKRGNYEFYMALVTDRSRPIKDSRSCRKISKHFNINKLGKQKAFELAKEWLVTMRVKLDYKGTMGSCAEIIS